MSNAAMKFQAKIETPQANPGSILKLYLTSDRQIELIKTHFHCYLLPKPVIAVRGKTAGAFSTGATFQWTAAVQALTTLILKAAERYESKEDNDESSPLLEGLSGSLASSLDASLYKQTAWLDLFGATTNGDSLSRRVLTRSNPGRRRSGPVMISLNEKLIPTSCIEIYLDDQRVRDPNQLGSFVEKINQVWSKAHETIAIGNQILAIATESKIKGSTPKSGDAPKAFIQGRFQKV